MVLIWSDNPQAEEAGSGWLDGDLQARADKYGFELYVCGQRPHRPMKPDEAIALARAIFDYFGDGGA